MRDQPFLKNIVISLFSSLLLSACMVGPDYHSPTPVHTQKYTKSPLPAKTVATPSVRNAGKSQRFVFDEALPHAWWELFHSSTLDDLIRVGLENSPNLIAAKATLIQAQENYNAQVGAMLYPNVQGLASADRMDFSSATIGEASIPNSIFNLYNVSATVSYTLDIFGGIRRGLEALRAQVDYEKFELEAARLTLTANIVTAAIMAASMRAQIKATHSLIHLQKKALDIVKTQFYLGGASGSDVLSQQSQLAQTRATLPPLAQQLAQAEHLLAVLVGVLPSEANIPTFHLDQFTLPTRLPVSLPSFLVQQRPDIQASDALLHAASAQIGVATANLLPQLTISGNYGWEALSPSQLFVPNSKTWLAGASLTQPIFNGGSLRAKRRAAIAAFDQAYQQYRQTVLQAFQNVADSLRALQHDAETLQAQRQAEIAALGSFKIAESRYRLGGVSYLDLLTAEKQYQQTLIARVQAQASRYSDTAALFQALGGGWWNGGDCEKQQWLCSSMG